MTCALDLHVHVRSPSQRRDGYGVEMSMIGIDKIQGQYESDVPARMERPADKVVPLDGLGKRPHVEKLPIPLRGTSL
jgi:hypothetical protein